MEQFDFRNIDFSSERDGYSPQEIIDIRTLAQVEMLRCRRQAAVYGQRVVTLSLFWGLFFMLYCTFSGIGGVVGMMVLALLAGVILVLRRRVLHADEAFMYYAEINRSFSEICVENYCDIDDLCRKYPAASSYVDSVAATGRALTYFELHHLTHWVEHHRSEKRKRGFARRVAGDSLPFAWLRRQPSTHSHS